MFSTIVLGILIAITPGGLVLLAAYHGIRKVWIKYGKKRIDSARVFDKKN